MSESPVGFTSVVSLPGQIVLRGIGTELAEKFLALLRGDDGLRLIRWKKQPDTSVGYILTEIDVPFVEKGSGQQRWRAELDATFITPDALSVDLEEFLGCEVPPLHAHERSCAECQESY